MTERTAWKTMTVTATWEPTNSDLLLDERGNVFCSVVKSLYSILASVHISRTGPE